MKKLNIFKKSLGKRNLTLSLVALILILLTTVSISYSWIEEVSNVELKSNDGTKTPLHISGRKLKSDISVQKEGSVVDLSDFFAESGDMHLSACYSDGTNFMFPQSGTSTTAFRKGTKSDANTNYISMTFRVTSNGAPTAYWFEYKDKSNTNPFIAAKDYTGETNAAGEKTTADHSPTTALKDYLRASITVNGATTVYGFNNNGQFKYLDGSTIKTATGSNNTPSPRPVKNYMYYNEQFNDTTPINSSGVGYWISNSTNAGYANQGAGKNLNGNTLFTVGEGKTETVTVKLWLEAGAPVTSIDASDINLQLTSSYVKTRRVYLRDMTVDEWDDGLNKARGETWLTDDPKARLYFAIIKDDEIIDHYPIVKSGGDVYYVDIRTDSGIQDMSAVYAGYSCAIYRCGDSDVDANNIPANYDPWDKGNSYSDDIDHWDKWSTTLPNTYHAEVYSIYSHEYGTWETEKAKSTYFVDSCKFEDVNSLNAPSAYLWDSTSEYGTGKNDKVVTNSDWPGKKMTKMSTKVGNLELRTWASFYSSKFDRAVFSDARTTGPSGGNPEYQTQNINDILSMNGKYFDMATLSWYTNKDKLPGYTDNYIYSEFQGGGNWGHTRFAYKDSNTQSANNSTFMNGTSGSKEVCRFYIKYAGDYKFKVKLGSQEFGYGDSDGGHTMNKKDTLTLYPNNPNAVKVHFPTSYRIYRFYLEFETKNIDGQNRQCPKLYFANDEDTQ